MVEVDDFVVLLLDSVCAESQFVDVRNDVSATKKVKRVVGCRWVRFILSLRFLVLN